MEETVDRPTRSDLVADTSYSVGLHAVSAIGLVLLILFLVPRLIVPADQVLPGGGGPFPPFTTVVSLARFLRAHVFWTSLALVVLLSGDAMVFFRLERRFGRFVALFWSFAIALGLMCAILWVVYAVSTFLVTMKL